MCSETSEAVGTTWEHAQLEFQNFLKIRITLLPYNLRVLLKYLPEGDEDSVSLVIGQLGSWPVSVKIWREGYQAFSSYYTYYNLVVSKSVEITGQEDMTLTIGG